LKRLRFDGTKADAFREWIGSSLSEKGTMPHTIVETARKEGTLETCVLPTMPPASAWLSPASNGVPDLIAKLLPPRQWMEAAGCSLVASGVRTPCAVGE
jgi:hypothetical protein